MHNPWTQIDLMDWGKESGFKVKKLESGIGVMYSPQGKTKTLFTIYIGSLDAGFVAEIAFNKGDPKALELMKSLKHKHATANPKTAHKWPRIGLKSFDPATLEYLAEVPRVLIMD